jgi:hypothetical protein
MNQPPPGNGLGGSAGSELRDFEHGCLTGARSVKDVLGADRRVRVYCSS